MGADRNGLRERSPQRQFNFVASQRLRKNLPLFRGFDIQGRIVIDFFIEQEIAIEMAKRRELAADTASVDLIRKKLLQKVAHIRVRCAE